jgi:hypothetical protein
MPSPDRVARVVTTDVSGTGLDVRRNPRKTLEKQALERDGCGAKKSFSQLVDKPMTVAILRPLVEPDRFTVPRREIAEKRKLTECGRWLYFRPLRDGARKCDGSANLEPQRHECSLKVWQVICVGTRVDAFVHLDRVTKKSSNGPIVYSSSRCFKIFK